MKKIVLLMAIVFPLTNVFGQQPYFEGTLIYHVSFTSKTEGVSDKFAHKLMAVGDIMTISIKNGNGRESSGLSETWSLPKEKKVYIKFKRLDTLYYLDYSFDTTAVKEVVKTDSVFKVGNYDCKAISIRTSKITKRTDRSLSGSDRSVYCK